MFDLVKTFLERFIVLLGKFTRIKLLATVIDLLKGVGASSQQINRRIQRCPSVTKLTAGNLPIDEFVILR